MDSRVIVTDGYETSGELKMSYVSMLKGHIPSVLLSFIIPNWDLVNKKDITINNESVNDAIVRDHLLLEEGLDNATFSAFKEANIDINIDKVYQVVAYISPDAKTDLKLKDIILSINGLDINSLEEMQKYINTLKKDEVVNFKVLRDDKEVECSATIYEDKNALKVGIAITKKYVYETNPHVTIKTKESESGSSGGLMTSLQIYNSITKEDITKNRVIVGTGTIDKNGNVGEIGGVKYKLLGASKKNADIFLLPKENYEEAKRVVEKYHLKTKIKAVGTLKEAIEFLKE